ncbi:MAG: ABC transporter permease [Kiritimatiellae bacterium]|nr:ABC transporter permease [Kiritimatiellia bacterium]
MRRYILKRLLELLPTTAGVLLLTFVLFHIVGVPAEVVLGQHANAASLAAFDARYGYDKPLLAGHWTATRAWADGTPWPADGVLMPAFPLPEGHWRVRLAARLSASVEIALASADVPRTNLLAAVSRSDSGRGSRVDFTVPAGWQAVSLKAGAPVEGAAVRLRRRTAHFLDSQLGSYLTDLLRGDLGESTAYGQRVAQVLRDGLGPSLSLTVPILLGGTLLALMLAMLAAVWREAAPDRVVLFVSTLLMSVNYVVWVLAGQFLLAYKLRLFPIWGYEHWTYLLLPVLIGIVSGLGRDIRFFRTVLLDELHRPYVRTAIAKGLSRSRILWVHVFRNSLIPIVTYVSLSVPFLFTGSLLLESFFGIPGLGGVSLNAIHSADMATVRAVVILGALLYQLVNLVTDLCYAWLDPRVRLA